MKIGFTETLVRQIEPIMRAIEELQKTGSLRYEKPYIPKRKGGRQLLHLKQIPIKMIFRSQRDHTILISLALTMKTKNYSYTSQN